MKRLLFIFGIWLWVTALVALPLEAILKELDTYIPHTLEAWGAPGCAVVIVKDGEVVYEKAFGTKRSGEKDPVDVHTVFPLASLSKTFTAVLIAQLVDEGLLHWDDKAVKYLPDFKLADPEATKNLTLQDMLSHRVGLPNFSGDTLGYLEWPASEIYSTMAQIPFEAPYGKTYAYQNIFYGIIGMIIEKVTGKDLSTLYQERIFKPLGLQETNIGAIQQEGTWWQWLQQKFGRRLPIRIEKNLTGLHDHVYPRERARYIPYNRYLYTFPSSSGVNASIHDLGKWLKFRMDSCKSLISEKAHQHLTTVHIPVPQKNEGKGFQFPSKRVTHNGYGVGFFIHDYLGHKAWTQMGGMNGIRTLISILPDDGIGIIIVSNLGGMRVAYAPESIRNKLFDRYLDSKDNPDWATQDATEMDRLQKKHYDKKREERLREPMPPAKNFSIYEGTYTHPLYGPLEIRYQGGQLILHYRQRSPIPLNHWNGHIFHFKVEDLTNSFPALDGGEVYLGVNENQSHAHALMVVPLLEGKDPIFQRTNEQRK